MNVARNLIVEGYRDSRSLRHIVVWISQCPICGADLVSSLLISDADRADILETAARDGQIEMAVKGRCRCRRTIHTTLAISYEDLAKLVKSGHLDPREIEER